MSANLSERKKKWLELVARIGLSAHGVVYLLIGLIVFRVAVGMSSRKGNKEDAFRFISEQPLGKYLLVIIGICLLGFVVLRFLQAFIDLDHNGKKLNGIFTRVGFAVAGLVNIGISLVIFKIAFIEAGKNESNEQLIRKVMDTRGGFFVILVIGIIVAFSGFFQGYKGFSGMFMKDVRLYRSHFRETYKKLGIIGHTARGMVLCCIGYILIRTAIESRNFTSADTNSAFTFLRDRGGNVLTGAVALGLICYGIFMFVCARHERIWTPGNDGHDNLKDNG